MKDFSTDFIELFSALNAKYLDKLFLNIIGVFFDSIYEFLLVNLIQFFSRFLKGNCDVFAEKSLRGLMNDPHASLLLNVIN